MMSLFNLTLSEKHFILPSILNDSFAGYSNLGRRSLRLILGNVIMMCLVVFLLGSSFFGTLWASWTSRKSISFARLGKVSFLLQYLKCSCPGQRAQLVRMLSVHQSGYGFDSQSGHIWEATKWCSSVTSVFVSLSLSLSLSVFQNNKYILDWGSKKF